MQPRWKKDDAGANWIARGYIYVGGTAKYDLWCESAKNNGHVRIVCGEATSDWDYINFPIGNPLRSNLTHFGDVPLTEEEAQEVETYLKLFAPWVLGESLTTKEKSET